MKKDEVLKHKKKKFNKLSLLLWTILFLLVGVVIMYLFSLGGASIFKILRLKEYWLSNGVVDGLILIGYLMMYKVDAQNIALNENDLEDTEWLTSKKLKKLKEFEVFDFDKTEEHKDGIVIGAEKKKNKIEITTTSQLHALIVGTTGSGKTTGFVDQNISVLSRSKGKPTLVISDPKQELYERHSKGLEEQGYKVSVLDLREPYTSARWNPMFVLIRRIRMLKELDKDVKSVDGKYYASGETYVVHKDYRTRKQELLDEIFENAMDLVYTLCPVKNKEQPSWEEGARNLILGFVIAMCEDCISGKLDEKQLLLFNVYHNITKYCKDDTTALKKYLIDSRTEFSKVRGLVNTVLITSDKTLTSYLSEVSGYMQQLTDDGILSLTSENDFDIVNMDEDPNAVFIIVPDERFTRHRFVTLFVTQMYKEFVEKANINFRRGELEMAILKRNAYFIMDEFGNLPKFDNLEGMITVSRSRGIRFLFVLQSFSQLAVKYGRDVGSVIKDNCNVKIFIGSDDPDTRKEFSELCGNKKIKQFSVNTTIENSPSSNTSATNQPLITMGMLERLNGNEKGDAIVSVRGYEPIWTLFTPSYELKNYYFTNGKAGLEKKEAVFFDKDNYVFDITGDTFKVREKGNMKIVEDVEKEPDKDFMKKREEQNNLTKEWDNVAHQIDTEIQNLSFLKGRDLKSARQAKLDGKASFLYWIMDQYRQSQAMEIQIAADKIAKELLPKLLEIQNKSEQKGE